jgi:hypothetical protein
MLPSPALAEQIFIQLGVGSSRFFSFVSESMHKHMKKYKLFFSALF